MDTYAEMFKQALSFWLSERCLFGTNKIKVPLGNLYTDWNEWTLDQDFDSAETEHEFEVALIERGMTACTLPNGERGVRGVTLRANADKWRDHLVEAKMPPEMHAFESQLIWRGFTLCRFPSGQRGFRGIGLRPKH